MIQLTLNVNLANMKSGGTLDIFEDKIVGIADMPMSGTVLILMGGGTIPVRESKNEVLNKINAAQELTSVANNKKKETENV